MSKQELLLLVFSTIPPDYPVMDKGDKVIVCFVSAQSATLYSECLYHMRNIESHVEHDGKYVVIPIDETGYTVRARPHDPEPRP